MKYIYVFLTYIFVVHTAWHIVNYMEKGGKLNHKNQWIKFEVFETKISQFEGFELITKSSQSMGFEQYLSYSILWDSSASWNRYLPLSTWKQAHENYCSNPLLEHLLIDIVMEHSTCTLILSPDYPWWNVCQFWYAG